MPRERLIATLLAFGMVYEIEAQDDAVELLNQLLSTALRKADNKGKAERLKTIPTLDRAAAHLRDAVRLVLDEKQPDRGLRAVIFEAISREQLEKDVQTVDALIRGEDETRYFDQLVDHYSHMRRFLPMLLQMIKFHSHAFPDPVLDALAFLRQRENNPEVSMEKAPLAVITKNWHKLVLSEEVPDHRFYALCALERLQDGLRRRDIFLPKSEGWGDLRAKLLQGDEWRRARPNVCRTLNRQADGEQEVKQLASQLDQAFRQAAEIVADSAETRVEKKKGRDRLCVSPLDKLDEPDSLVDLRSRVAALIPRVDLPEAVLEVQGWTGFIDEFDHFHSDRGTLNLPFPCVFRSTMFWRKNTVAKRPPIIWRWLVRTVIVTRDRISPVLIPKLVKSCACSTPERIVGRNTSRRKAPKFWARPQSGELP